MTEKKSGKRVGKKKVSEKRVVIYSTPTCPICKMAKDYFKKKGITYQDINVGADKEAAHEMIHLSGQMGVPVIMVDDTVVVGFNQVELGKLLAK
ncbi:hypothetical protein ES703_76833 [subsurface metagenome]